MSKTKLIEQIRLKNKAGKRAREYLAKHFKCKPTVTAIEGARQTLRHARMIKHVNQAGRHTPVRYTRAWRLNAWQDLIQYRYLIVVSPIFTGELKPNQTYRLGPLLIRWHRTTWTNRSSQYINQELEITSKDGSFVCRRRHVRACTAGTVVAKTLRILQVTEPFAGKMKKNMKKQPPLVWAMYDAMGWEAVNGRT